MGIRDELRDQAVETEIAQTVEWDQVGEEVAGIVTAVRDVTTRDGVFPVMDVREEETGAILSVWLSTTMLNQTLVGQHNVEPGDGVYIKYIGAEQTKKGLNPLKMFKIAVKKGAASPDGDVPF